MKKFTIGLVAAMLSLTTLASAEGTFDSLHSFGESILHYPTNRIDDLFDIGKANIGFGVGYDASAQVTNYLGFSVASVDDACNWGWNQGGVLPQVWHAGKEGAGCSLLGLECGDGLDPDNAWDVSASLHALIVGVGLGVDLEEAVDGVAGILLIDPSGDDDGPTISSGGSM